MKTRIRQSQLEKSRAIDDSLPLGGYGNLENLEEDLNYLRSVIKDLKGSDDYDSPMLQSLKDLADILENVSFDDATLTGNSTSDTPPLSDASTRIATTEYVTDKLNDLVINGSDARYIHTQNTPSTEWTVTHNLNKFPSVSVVDSAKERVEGSVTYINSNSLKVEFSDAFSGQAFIN